MISKQFYINNNECEILKKGNYIRNWKLSIHVKNAKLDNLIE